MKTMVRIASTLALLTAGVMVVGAARQPLSLPFALVPLMAGIGILRRRAWSAYGYALYQGTPLLLLPLLAARGGGSALRDPAILAGVVFGLAMVVLCLLAGRALSADGVPGHRWPWITLSAIILVTGVCCQAFVIPNSSMENTLLVGDKILVQRWPPPHVEHGTIIAFHYPVDPRQTFLKRVVALPGDRVALRDKHLYVNGAAVREPWARHTTDYLDSYRDNFPSQPNMTLSAAGTAMLEQHVRDGAVVVPPGHYFVLGDNRDSSFDSRYWGFVPAAGIIGRPLLIYDSTTSPDIPATTRWSRLFRIL